MVRQLWADLKANDALALEAMMAPGFQSVHSDGARDKGAELDLIGGLDLGEYTLGDFKVTQNGPVLIVTYFVSVEETIGDHRMSTEPAARLTAFLLADDGWQWIAHANLKPLK